MGTIYKILFEVKLLHEYYFTNATGESIFDLNVQADRINFLREKYISNRQSINSDIAYSIPTAFENLYRNHRVKLLTSYSGFKIAIEVKAIKMPDGTTTYLPKFPLPDYVNIAVLLLRKNNLSDSFTNKNFNSPLNGKYYFTNENLSGIKSFPYLTTDINLFDPAINYEQGALVKFATNDYRSFYRDDSNIVNWLSFTGKGFANENDRMLVNTNFSYTFPAGANVTVATLTLKDANGSTIKNKEGNVISVFNVSDPAGLSKINLAIDPASVLTIPNIIANEKCQYTLEVNGNNGYGKIHSLFFMSAEIEAMESIGVINIQPKVTNAAFNLLDNNGKLFTIKQANGTINPAAPIFEINFKSRQTFWRYSNSKKKPIQSGLHADFLLPKNGTLITKTPRTLTYIPTLFKKPNNTLYYLPNPDSYAAIINENGKIYSDINVRESDLFPII
jgi:hypothetical protein